MKLKAGGKAVCSIVFCILLFLVLQRLVEPKYAKDILEGNFTEEYYEETTKHDVIFIGDCEVYENFNPMYLWKKYGITSYIRGNAQQLAWQSYYMLEDTLKYETPKVVIYNIQALVYDTPQKEEYNRMTLDGMKWSAIKYKAIKASMCEGEKMLDYIVPILRYHERFLELSADDFKYFWKDRKVSHNGYYMRVDVLPVSESEVADPTWLLGTENSCGGTEESGEIEHPWNEIEKSGEIEDPWNEIERSGESRNSGNEIEENGEIEDPWNKIEKSGESEAPWNAIKESGEIEDPWNEIKESEEIEAPWNEIKENGESKNSENEIVNREVESYKDETDISSFGTYPMEYLDKMRKLCEKNKIQLILIKAPSLAPQWYDSENAKVLEYAEKYKLPYINFYELLEETGLDYETDTYDGGLHMNLSGSEKLSEYLGNILISEYGVNDYRMDETIAKVYEEKYQFYEEMIEAQKKELEKYGEIKSY